MEEKMIRFIDSEYNNLFFIPDEGKIIVTRPDLNETYISECKYHGETHVDIGRECYHICQFAEVMERIGATYEPESPYILQVARSGEQSLSCSPSSEERNPKLIGHMRGDFGSGQEFHHSWFDYQPAFNTPEFKADFQKAVDTFRQTVLKDIYTMSRFCNQYRKALIENSNNAHCFKANSGKYQYFLRATPRKCEYNFYCYCYLKEPERVLEKAPVQSKNKKRKDAPER